MSMTYHDDKYRLSEPTIEVLCSVRVVVEVVVADESLEIFKLQSSIAPRLYKGSAMMSTPV